MLSVILSLLLQTASFAAPSACCCAKEAYSTTAHRCCRSTASNERRSGCPHCQRHVAANTSCGDGESVRGDSTCHCHLVPLNLGDSLISSEGVLADAVALTPFADELAKLEVVCAPRPAIATAHLPFPDSDFRRIVLCVWLT
ncbi:hypothetical protein LOC69_23150 [Blastopirellula sp. JC733]|nr:hypothetical protein [Blastopirellula sediminis]